MKKIVALLLAVLMVLGCTAMAEAIHWGKERVHTPTAYCKSMGPKMIDAGADLVIGNHSHVYGTIYQYKGKYIIYSLGNFVFGGNNDPYYQECTIFRQKFTVSKGKAVDAGIDIIPARLSSNREYNDFKPMIMDAKEGYEQLKKVAAVSNFVPTRVNWLEDSYVYEMGILPKPDDTDDQPGLASNTETTAEPTVEPTATPAPTLAPNSKIVMPDITKEPIQPTAQPEVKQDDGQQIFLPDITVEPELKAAVG